MSGALNHHRTISKRAKSSSLSRDRDPRVKEFLAAWAIAYRERAGQPYHVAGGKDGALVKGLLNTFELPRLTDLLTTFFNTADPWIQQKSGYTIGVFASQINKLNSIGQDHSPTRREMPA